MTNQATDQQIDYKISIQSPNGANYLTLEVTNSHNYIVNETITKFYCFKFTINNFKDLDWRTLLEDDLGYDDDKDSGYMAINGHGRHEVFPASDEWLNTIPTYSIHVFVEQYHSQDYMKAILLKFISNSIF